MLDSSENIAKAPAKNSYKVTDDMRESKFFQYPFVEALQTLSVKNCPFPESNIWDQLLYSQIPLPQSSYLQLTRHDKAEYSKITSAIAEDMGIKRFNLELKISSMNFNYLLLIFLTQLRKMRHRAYDGYF
jgi:hypothetical protein